MKIGKLNLSWGIEEPKSNVRTLNKELYAIENQIKEADSVMLRKVALREPFFMKAATKKIMDSLRNGFEIKTFDENKKIDKTDKQTFYQFEERTNFIEKLANAGVCAFIYGTGFLEPIFKSELGKRVNTESKPDEKDEVVNINVINPEFIKGLEPKRDGGELYWIYEEVAPATKKYVHYDRLIPVIIDSLPFSKFGISKVHELYNILKSKLNADVAAGEMLAWSSTGIQDMTIQDMDENQEREMKTIFDKHPDAFVHDQDYELQVLNPNRIDPKPYHEFLVENIAAGFNMPYNVLIGNLSTEGGETSIADYIHDCEDIQKYVFTPIITRIYKNIQESKGKKWRYYLDWNIIYVNELSEAKILQTRTFTVTQCHDRGIIDTEESRHILNEGAIVLDIEKEIKKSESSPVAPANPNVPPNIEPQPSVKKPSIRSISPEEKKMIEQLAKYEHELGIKETFEQEKRLKEAKDNASI